MTSYRLGGALLAAATLLSTILTGTATGTPTHAPTHTPTGAATADQHPESRLYLTVRASAGASSTVRLDCRPAGGSHPEPLRACVAVAAADGDFDHLPGPPDVLACTLEYRPVVAVARGIWRGDLVRWRHEFSNPCTLHSETGVVFDF
ncbi:SSI family serine proteinase inhibitor [Actinophytocola sp.]|uniref:SSI family serine proteinase inhibitor n=1 Tax=Actinophytocola sp. TaxID=1872138 RepID=UPI003D6BED6C